MNYIKFCKKYAALALTSGLVSFQLANSAAQSVNGTINCSVGDPPGGSSLQMSASGTTNGAISRAMTGCPDALQGKFYRLTLLKLFVQSQAGIKAVTASDKFTSKSAPDGIADSGAIPDPVPKSPWDFLASAGLTYSKPAQPLLVEHPIAESPVSLDEEFKFEHLNPPVQIASKDQVLHIGNISTRAWTTIIGWHPCEASFFDAGTYEPHFDLFWVGAAPQQ